jgi:hypothetical protein
VINSPMLIGSTFELPGSEDDEFLDGPATRIISVDLKSLKESWQKPLRW